MIADFQLMREWISKRPEDQIAVGLRGIKAQGLCGGTSINNPARRNNR